MLWVRLTDTPEALGKWLVKQRQSGTSELFGMNRKKSGDDTIGKGELILIAKVVP